MSMGTLVFVALTMLVCLVIFYKLTITIDSESVSFRLGIGLISRKYYISDIQSCKAVRNSFIYGIGIKKIPGGWLYNVSGLNSIELTFKNKGSKVRIGTNNADTISSIVNLMLRKENKGRNLD